MSGFRRTLHAVHRWAALIAGAYLLLISLTGASLLFRIDLQRALDPQLFTPVASGAAIDAATTLQRLAEAYPGRRISGIDLPTNRRPTTLAYVLGKGQFLTVLLDPASGQVLGELPQRPLIHTLQALHFELALGSTGRVINGIGALLLAGLGVTGLILWWRGRRRWIRGLIVRRGQSTVTTHRELHNAAGIWTSLAVLMWGITGAAFIFPRPFTAAIGWFSPTQAAAAPTVRAPEGATPAPLRAQIAAAVARRPGRPIARIVLPTNSRAPLQVVFARHSPTHLGESLDTVYVDAWRATAMDQAPAHTAGQALWESFSTLHTAAFGGYGARVLWLLFALSPALLLVTGLTTWWLRRFR